MIAPKERARAISTGKASTLILPARPGKAGAPYARIPLHPGGEYPVRSTTDRDTPKCHIRITTKTRGPLAVTPMVARRAGYRTSTQFIEDWVLQHDRAWVARHKGQLETPGDDAAGMLAARFAARWDGSEVWVIGFEVVHDTLWYLAQPSLAQRRGDYTSTRALAIDHLPVIDAAHQARYSRVANEQREGVRRGVGVERQARRNARLDMFRAPKKSA